jgi:hypothetical protein
VSPRAGRGTGAGEGDLPSPRHHQQFRQLTSSPYSTILANATRLCEASYGTLWLCEGDAFRVVALHGALPAPFVAERRLGAVIRPNPRGPMARAARTRHAVHVADLRLDEAYLDRSAPAARWIGVRPGPSYTTSQTIRDL